MLGLVLLLLLLLLLLAFHDLVPHFVEINADWYNVVHIVLLPTHSGSAVAAFWAAAALQ